MENLKYPTVGRWNITKKLKIMENEKSASDEKMKSKSLKNVKNKKCTLKDLE